MNSTFYATLDVLCVVAAAGWTLVGVAVLAVTAAVVHSARCATCKAVTK